MLRLVVSVEGVVEEVALLKPAGPAPELRRLLLETVGAWRFEPALLNGKPVPVFYNVSLNHCA